MAVVDGALVGAIVGALVGESLKTALGISVNLGFADGVMVSGDRKKSPDDRWVVVEGVGLVQAYGEASLLISGRPSVSNLGTFLRPRRFLSSSLVGGVVIVFPSEGSNTKRRS